MDFRCTSVLLVIALATTTSAFNRIPKYLENPAAEGKLWAVLVAGSDTWDNYRHQADICHSYQILKRHGIPDERIIVLMKDDIANNEQNPTKGIVINHPKGKDVYKGVPKDYTGEAVTPKNFLAVLKGDKKAVAGVGSGKVLESGPNDHVFVYFADHGAPGIIAFPEDELSSTDLNNAIKYMHKKKMYGKMVFYIEACESGSMFDGLLPNNINVYATTAANPEESSYAIYFDDERETYLGDSYSVHWMEDSDKEVLSSETLEQQFKIVKKETVESHAQEYGDLSIAQMHVSEFQGKGGKGLEPIVLPQVERDSVRSRDVPLEIVRRKFLNANSEEEQSAILKKLNKMYRNREFLKNTVSHLVTEIYHNEEEARDVMVNKHKLRNFQCYDTVRAYFNEECFRLSKNAYALDYMYVLVNLCEKGVQPDRVKAAMERVCIHPPTFGIL